MKNIINIFLTICVAVFFSAHANAKTKVSLWSESAAEPAFSALNQIVADFNASQDEIEVEHTAYENTPYETTLKTAFLEEHLQILLLSMVVRICINMLKLVDWLILLIL